jgi:hypothetical protein
MAILDKLAFWRKKDEFDLGDLGPMPGEEGREPGLPGMERPMPSEKLGFPGEEEMPGAGFAEEPGAHPALTAPAGMPEEPGGPLFGAPPGQTPRAAQGYTPSYPAPNRDLELLNAKLDAIRAQLESINQRLSNIERLAKSSEYEERY